jgi:hypothetical protein
MLTDRNYCMKKKQKFIRKASGKFTITLPVKMMKCLGWDIDNEKGNIPVQIFTRPNTGEVVVKHRNKKPVGITSYYIALHFDAFRKNPKKYQRDIRKIVSSDPQLRKLRDETDWNNVKEEWRDTPEGKEIIKKIDEKMNGPIDKKDGWKELPKKKDDKIE